MKTYLRLSLFMTMLGHSCISLSTQQNLEENPLEITKSQALNLARGQIEDIDTIDQTNILSLTNQIKQLLHEITDIEEIIFEDNDMDDTCLYILFPTLKQNIHVIHLNLTNNIITRLDDLVQLTHLRSLDLTKNLLDNGAIDVLAKNLISMTALTWLNLANNKFNNIAYLTTSLSNSTTLKTLILNHNRVGNKGAQDILNLLKYNTSIKTISIEQCGIDDSWLQQIRSYSPQCQLSLIANIKYVPQAATTFEFSHPIPTLTLEDFTNQIKVLGIKINKDNNIDDALKFFTLLKTHKQLIDNDIKRRKDLIFNKIIHSIVPIKIRREQLTATDYAHLLIICIYDQLINGVTTLSNETKQRFKDYFEKAGEEKHQLLKQFPEYLNPINSLHDNNAYQSKKLTLDTQLLTKILNQLIIATSQEQVAEILGARPNDLSFLTTNVHNTQKEQELWTKLELLDIGKAQDILCVADSQLATLANVKISQLTRLKEQRHGLLDLFTTGD